MAQIASGIAINFNENDPFFQVNEINEDLVFFAGLAHDLGHPPFGHNGEKALDGLAADIGGFEGNAQTLRILSRLEKKATASYPSTIEPSPVVADTDNRYGLNLTYRTLASVLKYSEQIPRTRDERQKNDRNKPVKGIYFTENELVEQIQMHVVGNIVSDFKTVECGIMDVADDIAYSTYDLEDALKGGFISPLKMLSFETEFKEQIIKRVNEKIKEQYPSVYESEKLATRDFDDLIALSFKNIFAVSEETKGKYPIGSTINDDVLSDIAFISAGQSSSASVTLSDNGYFRGAFTSKLVTQFMNAVKIEINTDNPQLSKVYLDIDTFKKVEFLKVICYKSIIESPRLKMAERRGGVIIKKIFRTLTEESEGRRLLPEDWREIYLGFGNKQMRKRTVCDFIASMTDRYCVEFYSRIVGLNPPSIHKPY